MRKNIGKRVLSAILSAVLLAASLGAAACAEDGVKVAIPEDVQKILAGQEDADASLSGTEEQDPQGAEQITAGEPEAEIPDVSEDEPAEVDEEEQAALEARVEEQEELYGMDENGNTYLLDTEPGIVDVKFRTMAIGADVVNFNTKGSATTDYTEVGTGISGYVCGSYGADAAYLGTSGGKVRFMLAGVIGEVNQSEVQILSGSSVQSLSHYIVSDGKLLHKITSNLTRDSYGSTLDQGNAPSYLQSGVKYYSYDGHYFYTESNFSAMLSDYKAGNRAHAVNPNQPYFNYYQFLPLRSKITYSGSTLNASINGRTSSNSMMRDIGSTLVNAQNQYGTNALLVTGVAANESGWGTSNIARNKNNLFGMNAVDSSPGQSANYFESVEQCIKDFTETFMSKQYLNPANWKYFGGYLGNKASGINVKYASDPYWGEKAANVAWSIDRENGGDDMGRYRLGMKDVLTSDHTSLNIRKEATTSSTRLYGTGAQANYAVIILGEASGFYKLQSDPVLNSGRTGIDTGSGVYNFDNMYVYASKDYITEISSSSGGFTTLPWSAKSISASAGSPRPMLEEITLTANVDHKKAGLQYKFVWQKDNWKEWGVIQNFSNSDKATWKPETSGNYQLIVDVQDGSGKVEHAYLDYQIASWGVRGIDTDLAEPQALGTPIRLMASTVGSAGGLQYKFVWQKDNWKEWGVIRNFDSSTSVIWNPTSLGKYQILMDVKDGNGLTTTKSISYEIAKKTWRFDGIGTDKESPQDYGNSVRITARVTNANSSLKYKFIWMRDNWADWGVIRQPSPEQSVSWTPGAPGNYYIYVDVTDGVADNMETLRIPYVVRQGSWNITGIATSPSGSQRYGKPVTITPQISGSKAGLEYKYVWMRDNWADWGVIKTFSSSESASWTPARQGSYRLYVDVKDRTGAIKTYNIPYSAVAKTWTYEKVEVNQISPQETGRNITITPKISGDKSELEYKYVWQRDNWTEWGLIKDYSGSTSASWAATKPGNYTLIVDVREKGSTAVESRNIPFQIVRGTWTPTGIHFDMSSPQVAHKDIGIAAEVIGNTAGLEYKFVWQKDNWAKWGVIRQKDSSNRTVWTPEEAGTYTICADISDRYGNVVTIRADYVIEDWQVRVSSARVKGGDTVTVSVEGIENNRDLEYKYLWMRDNWSSWELIKSFSNSQSVKWTTPKKAGFYYVYVDFRDKATNKTETKRIRCIVE